MYIVFAHFSSLYDSWRISGKAHTVGNVFFLQKKQQKRIHDFPKFGKGLCHVVFYRPFADVQPLGNFFVAQSVFPTHNEDVPALSRHFLHSDVNEQR